MIITQIQKNIAVGQAMNILAQETQHNILQRKDEVKALAKFILECQEDCEDLVKTPLKSGLNL